MFVRFGKRQNSQKGKRKHYPKGEKWTNKTDKDKTKRGRYLMEIKENREKPGSQRKEGWDVIYRVITVEDEPILACAKIV